MRLDDGTELHAARIVNAGGAEAGELVSGLPIRKRKGHLVITDRYPGFVRHQLVELGYLKSAHSLSSDSVAFNVQPRRTGQVLIGSSRQYNAEDPAVDAQILTTMIERAQWYMPDDRCALCDSCLDRISGGHSRQTSTDRTLAQRTNRCFWRRVTRDWASPRRLEPHALLADHLQGIATKIPIEPYLPARFARSEAHA